jgi:hypothetical protein
MLLFTFSCDPPSLKHERQQLAIQPEEFQNGNDPFL